MKQFLFLISTLILISCSATKNNFINTDILQQVNNGYTPKGTIRLSKRRFFRVNHKDTLIEKKYEFIVPKKYKNFSSYVGTFPVINIFNYSNGQKVITLENNNNKNKTIKKLNISKNDFINNVAKLKSSYRIKTFLSLEKIELKRNRRFGIIEKTNVLYLLININNHKNFSIYTAPASF